MRNFVVCGLCGAAIVSHPVTLSQHQSWHAKLGDGKVEAYSAFSLLEAQDFPQSKFRVPREAQEKQGPPPTGWVGKSAPAGVGHKPPQRE